MSFMQHKKKMSLCYYFFLFVMIVVLAVVGPALVLNSWVYVCEHRAFSLLRVTLCFLLYTWSIYVIRVPFLLSLHLKKPWPLTSEGVYGIWHKDSISKSLKSFKSMDQTLALCMRQMHCWQFTAFPFLQHSLHVLWQALIRVNSLFMLAHFSTSTSGSST